MNPCDSIVGGLLSLIGVTTFIVGCVGIVCTLIKAHIETINLIGFWYILLIAAGLLILKLGNRLQGWTMFHKK